MQYRYAPRSRARLRGKASLDRPRAAGWRRSTSAYRRRPVQRKGGRRTFFDHSALAHDHHPLTDRANNRKVMTDEGERQTHFARQLLEEAQHLRLRRNVEPGDDLVGENEIRSQHHGARDADTLTLSAGKLERIPLDRIPLHPAPVRAQPRGLAPSHAAGPAR